MDAHGQSPEVTATSVDADQGQVVSWACAASDPATRPKRKRTQGNAGQLTFIENVARPWTLYNPDFAGRHLGGCYGQLFRGCNSARSAFSFYSTGRRSSAA